MRAGFERHVSGSALRLHTGFAQRMDLGVGLPGAFVPALPHHALAVGDDAAHARIGLSGVQAAFGQAQRLRHVHSIDDGESHGSF